MKTFTHLFLIFAMPFIANAQLQNMNFEDWINPTDDNTVFNNKPTGWLIGNGLSLHESTTLYYPPSTDAQNGDYALKLGIWYNYTKDLAQQTAPIASRPAALTGYYKYSNNDVYSGGFGLIKDKASATIYLTKWNAVLAQNDTIGSGKIFLDATDDYAYFSCPVIYSSANVPDSITVILDCSLLNNPGNNIMSPESGIASFFTVDNIQLTEDSMGVTTSVLKKSIAIYPNPVADVLNFPGLKGTANIYDAAGKLVLSQQAVEHTINLVGIASGIYMLQLKEGNILYHAKFIKQ